MKKNYNKEALRWLIQAKDEFEDADELRKRGRFYLALFHFQQAAEKALKAYLYSQLKSVEVFYTHSIDELLNNSSEINKEFKKVKEAKKLDRYYIPTRYPNGIPGGIPSRYFDDPEEALDAMKLVKSVIAVVEKNI